MSIRLLALAGVGFVAGLAAAVAQPSADACKCAGPARWTLHLTSAPPEDDRPVWGARVILTETSLRDDQYDGLALTLRREAAP